jgi:hypothetical protein
MKGAGFLIITVMLVFLCPAFAKALEAEIIPGSQKVRQWDFATFDLKVHNDMEEKKSLLISVDGPHLEWKMPGNFLSVLESGETKITKIVFRPLMEGEYVYTVRVSCFTQPDVYVEKEFSMDISGEGLSLRNLRADAEDGRLHLIFDVVSWEGISGIVKMEMLKPDGTLAASSEQPIFVEGEKRMEEWLSLKGLLAGSYTVRVSAGDSVLEEEFFIPPVSKVTTRSTYLPGALYDEVLVTVENAGSLVEEYVLREDIPSGAVTGFVTKPQGCVSREAGMECEFLVGNLLPGETRDVVYRIEHWPTYVQYAAGLVVLIALGVLSVGEASKPRIKKKVVKRDKGHHTVILEVRNPFKDLNNVIVRDFVSPLATVHRKFEHLTPVVKRSDAGTELIWKLGRIKPKEVRILSYKMKPVVGGELKMPKAYLRYRGKDGKRLRVFSRHLFV